MNAPIQKPGKSIADGKGRVFPCEGCGADLEFHIGQQELKCPFCGFQKQLEFAEDATVEERDFHAMLENLQTWREDGHSQETGQSEIHCSGCAGTVVFQGTLTSTTCPYCGAPIQLDKVHDAEHRIPVDGVLPFLVERKVAQQRLTEWVTSRWFAPGEFTQRGVEGKFNGVYLPFWTFDSLTFTRYSGERGDNYTITVGEGNERRTETHIRWVPASGAFQRVFDDVLILASRGLPQWIIDRLDPWPLEKLVPFSQAMLAGFFARTYEKELEPGFQEAQQRMETALQAEVVQRIGGDHQRVQDRQSRYDAITFKHLLLPVWLLAYRYGDKSFQVAVNAATGEVQGERPYSWIKIAFAVLLGTIAAGVLVVLLNQ